MKKIILIVFIFIYLSFILSLITNLFWGDEKFLIIPFLAGIGLIIIQKENKSYKFLVKLVIGSVLFSFIISFWLIGSPHFMEVLSWSYFNKKDYLTFSLAFSFVSFMGGLVGIVFKGFYFLLSKK